MSQLNSRDGSFHDLMHAVLVMWPVKGKEFRSAAHAAFYDSRTQVMGKSCCGMVML